MKRIYFRTIFVLILGLVSLKFTPKAQAVPDTDILPPSVIEIPPLKDPKASPAIDITKILGQDMEEGTLSFTEQPSRQFADEILIRLNQVVSKGDNISDQSGSLPSNVNKIRQSLEMKSLNYDNLENRTSNDIPIKNIP